MGYAAKIVADSIHPTLGTRLTTFEITFPRIVLAEFNTHRMLSRNSASSRAIPVEKRIKAVEEDPFIPEQFGKNQRGMQAVEALTGTEDRASRICWKQAMNAAVSAARELAAIGVHKQLANRLLEPFSWHTVVATATDWSNFFHLRCHPDAQPEIRTVAEMMRNLYDVSLPASLWETDWHLPYVQPDELEDARKRPPGDTFWPRISSARCGRVSYLTHDGFRSLDADVQLYDRFVVGGHMSPLEHVARPMNRAELKAHEFDMPLPSEDLPPEVRHHTASRDAGTRKVYYAGNLNGWMSLRKLVPGEDDILGWRERQTPKERP